MAERNPDVVKTARSTPVQIKEELKSLFPGIHRRIMKQSTPQIPRAPNFTVGRKKVYLPNIVISLRRNTKLEPFHAVFDVPLNLSKLDLRDYLWHLYGVKSISIRSSVLPGILQRKYKVPDQARRIGPMRRTKARKKMIVQLAKPFRYPRELTKGELKEYVVGCIWLMVGFPRIGTIKLRNGESGDSCDASWVLRTIRIPCTMYTTNGVRIACQCYYYLMVVKSI
jgi:hypothetical protein